MFILGSLELQLRDNVKSTLFGHPCMRNASRNCWQSAMLGLGEAKTICALAPKFAFKLNEPNNNNNSNHGNSCTFNSRVMCDKSLALATSWNVQSLAMTCSCSCSWPQHCLVLCIFHKDTTWTGRNNINNGPTLDLGCHSKWQPNPWLLPLAPCPMPLPLAQASNVATKCATLRSEVQSTLPESIFTISLFIQAR